MSKVTYDLAIKRLRQSKANITCQELVGLLEDLGYEVREGRRGNHRTFTHPELTDWTGGNFDCGHGRNPPILPVYIGKIIKLLEQHKVEIEG